MSQAVAQRILREGDFRALRKHWSDVFPHLPGPTSDSDAEIVLHHARTQANAIPFKLRAYSHRWLSERELPSGLPDELKPRAERIYPTVAEAVMISVGAKSELMKPAVPIVRGAMEDAVNQALADGKMGDPVFVRARIQEARQQTIRELFGSLMKG